ncbi:hypothetical protein EJB05_38299, partial [Eragrostis curvula]
MEIVYYGDRKSTLDIHDPVSQQLRQGLYIVCNPTTRQWTNLPVLAPSPCSAAFACGFYFHGPSGEYRLLCHGVDVDDHDGWKDHHYTLSAGAAAPRRLARAPSDADRDGYEFAVAHRGVLYWYCRHPESARTGKMLAFRTDTETFRLAARRRRLCWSWTTGRSAPRLSGTTT